MKIKYQSNTCLSIIVDHDKKTYEYDCSFNYDCLVNVGTNKALKNLEKALLKGGYIEQ